MPFATTMLPFLCSKHAVSVWVAVTLGLTLPVSGVVFRLKIKHHFLHFSTPTYQYFV